MCDGPEKIEVSAEQFETFKAACLRWRERLGLHWFELMFVQEDHPTALATTRYDSFGTWATIRLCKTWDTPRPLNEQTLDDLARHEIIHLLVSELSCLASERYCQDADQITAADERLVRRIEALFERGVLT